MRVIKLIFFIAISTFVTGCCTVGNGTSPKGLEAPIEKAAIKFSSDVKAGGYRIVTTEELKRWLDDGKEMTIISSLPSAEDRSFGMLPGAVNAFMPKSERDIAPEDRERLLRIAGSDKERILVVYCGFVACRRSHIGANLLVDNGYKNVFRYPAGITGWGQAGYPVMK